MEPGEIVSLKKQRNAKIRRDNRQNKYNRSLKTDTADSPGSESSENTTSTPQPQRVNYRQRNESTTNSPVAAEVTDKVASKEVNENTMVDHSNLKRETEEIVKLTKKFSKREVSSNWHRYTTEESDPSVQHVEEEDAPADFTDLLQVPVSRGGHLQLKEEQGWSSAVPKGHWALNLHQLSFSVACIPTHERLRLPVDKLSEEEIQQYVFLAEEAKKYYNAYEGADSKDDVSFREKPFNILDVERSTNTLINMDLGLDTSSNKSAANNIDTLKLTNSNVSDEVKLNDKQNIIKHDQGLSKTNDLLSDKQFDINKTNSSDLLPNDKFNKSSSEATLQEKMNQQTLDSNHLDKNEFNEVKLINPLHAEVPDLKTIEKCNADPINKYEIKEKRQRRTNNRRPSFKEEIDSKAVEKVNEIKLEDEDDLDFLLSLKKPILSENKSESKSVDLKDSSFLPVSTVASSTTTPQLTDLDDWLDSVLED